MRTSRVFFATILAWAVALSIHTLTAEDEVPAVDVAQVDALWQFEVHKGGNVYVEDHDLSLSDCLAMMVGSTGCVKQP